MDVIIPDDVTGFASWLWAWTLDFLPRLGGALLVLVVGYLLARYVSRGVGLLATRSGRIEPTIIPVLRAVVRYGIMIIVIVAALGQLGVQTASVLAALGAAGLAIGLALQGTLANVAAGLMLLWLRPFKVGDYVETTVVAGTVEEINLFNTRIRTWDGIYKFTPNSELWSKTITNYTRNPTRLILIEFGLSYENDMAKGRKVLLDLAGRHPQVLKDPPVQVVPLSLADSSVVLQLRAWAPTPDFWNIRWDLTEQGKLALEAAGLTIPFPQLVVHVADGENQEPTTERLPPPRRSRRAAAQRSATADPSGQESADDEG